MPSGKNYVNNNKGVSLQPNAKAMSTMKLCEYGAGCTRPDCIYRHEGVVKRDEVCLPFLAGKCSFKDSGCRKRHPKKDEKARLIAKYKRTRCRFGDECYTDGCLYLHPREVTNEPSYIEPHHIAFPPLNDATAAAVPRPVANSAWKAAPLVAPPMSLPKAQPPVPVAPVPPLQQPPMENVPIQAWNPMDAPMYAPYCVPPPTYFDPAMHGYHPPMPYYGAPMPHYGMPHVMHFNAEAKEFVPGNSMA